MSLNIKQKFARARLERRLAHAETWSNHPRKGDYWRKVADELRRRIRRLTPK